MWWHWLLVLLVCVVGTRSYAFVVQRREERRHGCSAAVRYPHFDPLLGLDFVVPFMRSVSNGRSFPYHQDLFRRYGRTFVSVSWGRPVVHTMEPGNFRTVLSSLATKFAVAPIRYKALSPLLGDGVFVTDGRTHEQARNLMKPVFMRSHQRDAGPLHRHVQRLLESIPHNGRLVDMQPLLHSLFTDASTEYLLGRGTASLASEKSAGDARVNAFLNSFFTALSMCGIRQALGKFRFLAGSNKPLQRECHKVHAVMDEFVNETFGRSVSADESVSDRETFIDELRSTMDDRVEVRYHLLNILIAALDTPAIGLSGMLFQLARHPHIWSRLRKEAIGYDASLSFESVKSMIYLQCVMKESLRLIAPFGRNSRMCVEDCILPLGGGPDGKQPILVRRGTEINLVYQCAHRDPDIWGEDADEFRPERWFAEKKSQWEYLPFSGGARVCPAQQMAMLDCGLVLARLAQEFSSLENMDTELDFVEEHHVAVQSRRGVQVSFR